MRRSRASRAAGAGSGPRAADPASRAADALGVRADTVTAMRLWKLLGVAGIAGVAATGAVLARGERQRRTYTADDVRARLHERAAAATETPPITPATPAELTKGRAHRLARLLRR